MPSWNIHIAQTERLFDRGGVVAHVVVDQNAFLFGTLVPDILVGYMVPGVGHLVPYRVTHFADAAIIPKPREREFWDAYVVPLLDAGTEDGFAQARRVPAGDIKAEFEAIDRRRAAYDAGENMDDAVEAGEAAPVAAQDRSVLDMVLGTWSHLLADNLWNTRTNEYLDALGQKPSRDFRIKKQGDFDGYGRTLPIRSYPRETEELLRAAAAFPQYRLDPDVVHDAIVVAHEIVRSNSGMPAHAPYLLLTEEFFERTFAEVLEATETALRERLP